MTPLVAGALVAGAAGAVYLYRKATLKGQVPGALPGVVNKLTKGKSYAALVTIAAQDGRAGHTPINSGVSGNGNSVPVGQTSVIDAATTMKAGLEQVGFKVLSAPVPRNAAEQKDFIDRNPSIWLVNLQWTQDGDNPGGLPGYILNIDYVLLPIQ